MTRAAIQTRPGASEDLSFVFATWLRSYRDSPFARRVRKDTFTNRHHALIEALLDRGAVIDVATPADDPGTILGYLVRETRDGRSLLHYAYTKRPFRRLGVFSRLASDHLSGCAVSHLTGDGELALRALGVDVDYDPYLAGPRLIVEAA